MGFTISETAFWRFQCFSHIFFLLSAVVLISASSGVTNLSETCLAIPQQACYVELTGDESLTPWVTHQCLAYSRSISSSTVICLYGLSLALYSTFSLIINASCGFVRRMVKFHLAFNVVEGLLALISLILVIMFDHSVYAYVTTEFIPFKEGNATNLVGSPECLQDLETIIMETCMPAVIIFLAISLLIHACNPIVINHLIGFDLDFKRLVTSSAILPKHIELPRHGERDRLPSSRHFPSSPIVLDTRLQCHTFD